MVVRDGDAPVSHGALRVALGDGGKFLLCVSVGKGVQQGDGVVERVLDRARARDREIYPAKSLRGGVIVLGMDRSRGPRGRCDEDGGGEKLPHWKGSTGRAVSFWRGDRRPVNESVREAEEKITVFFTAGSP